MNVLLVTRPLSPPWNEGGKNLAYGIAKNITNYKIHILTRKNFNEKLKNNVIVHKIYNNKYSYNPTFFEKLKLFLFLLNFNKADIYHFIYTPELYSSFINKFLMKTKVKKSIQTIPTRIKNTSNLKKLIFADKVVVLSDYSKNLLIKNGINNVIKINTGVDINYFKSFKKDKKLLENLNLLNKFIILIPIDLDPKNTRHIINIFKDFNANNIAFIFSYRSTNTSIREEKYLKKLFNKSGIKNILFLKNPKDIRNLINISNLIIYPVKYAYEKHEIPMILVECMAMEKPIIMFDIVPFNEIIKNKEGIKVKNELEMKNAILKFIRNKFLIKKIGKLARRRVINDFNIKKTAQLYNKVYKNLLVQ